MPPPRALPPAPAAPPGPPVGWAAVAESPLAPLVPEAPPATLFITATLDSATLPPSIKQAAAECCATTQDARHRSRTPNDAQALQEHLEAPVAPHDLENSGWWTGRR